MFVPLIFWSLEVVTQYLLSYHKRAPHYHCNKTWYITKVRELVILSHGLFCMHIWNPRISKFEIRFPHLFQRFGNEFMWNNIHRTSLSEDTLLQNFSIVMRKGEWRLKMSSYKVFINIHSSKGTPTSFNMRNLFASHQTEIYIHFDFNSRYELLILLTIVITLKFLAGCSKFPEKWIETLSYVFVTIVVSEKISRRRLSIVSLRCPSC